MCGVWRSRLEDILPVLGDVDRRDLLARNHDVVDRDALQIEDRQQHLAVALRDQRARFGDHRAQLIGAQRLVGVVLPRDTEKAQESVGDAIGEPHAPEKSPTAARDTRRRRRAPPLRRAAAA